MKYGVILGQDGMRSLDLDTSIRENAITWGEKTISMVPRDYWTPERIKQNKHRFVKKQVSNDDEESINSPSKFKSKETSALELPREPREAVETIPLIENDVRELIVEAHATEALLKANYVKPDLRKIANECKDLDENQKEKLYQVLVKHEPLFQGTRGNYTGPPVTL